MRRSYLTLFLALAVLCGVARGGMTYTFDNDAQGWQQSTVGYNGGWYEQLVPNTAADWTASYGVGSPDGSLHQDATTAWEGRAYWLGTKGITAESSLGDLTGKSLETYVRSTANWAGRVSSDTVYARWTIATQVMDGGVEKTNMWVSKAACSINLNDAAFGAGTDDDWVLENIQMVESNFFKWPTSNGDANQTFADVLSEYTSFGLAILPTPLGTDDPTYYFGGGGGTWGSGYTLLHYGAHASSGTATWGIDGFTAVPEPISLVFFGTGVAGVVGFLARRRAQRSA